MFIKVHYTDGEEILLNLDHVIHFTDKGGDACVTYADETVSNLFLQESLSDVLQQLIGCGVL